ncbi:saccharopine dehydrogenase C-terminal domain-containing protein [Phanerochaete sordida]|uniref:Saccharopine dehydrogenase C-terminal domain-containing protein n=1 Tax=Phanerochaete sordida TaxID=48140 RepID=A0A9P3LCR2_9APHY|nr:saccharopine dehydrogenase C-terminal domain-containing protein [Phanerochaete sordida]
MSAPSPADAPAPSPTPTEPRKILLLGSGLVARPAAEYIVRDPRNRLTVASRTLASAQSLAAGLPRTTATALDIADTPALEAAVAAHALVVSLVPYALHAAVIAAAVAGRTHVVTTSYVSAAMRALHGAACAAGIVVLNEVGLDPGIDHLYAVKTISEVHAKGGKITEFTSVCGGLPAPAHAGAPLGLKFSWSPRGALANCAHAAAYIHNDTTIAVPADELLAHAEPYMFSPQYELVAYPNRDATPFREFYGIPEARTVMRSNLRYAAFVEPARALVRIGWLDTAPKEWLVDGLSWAQVTQRLLGAADASESTLTSHITSVCAFPSAATASHTLATLRALGIFFSEKVEPRASPLDTLAARLAHTLAYAPGERDLVLLQHRFGIAWADGSTETRTATLEALGDPHGPSAMARLVGLPCGVAVQLVLDGVIAEPGVCAPYTEEMCAPMREVLEREGVVVVEAVVESLSRG